MYKTICYIYITPVLRSSYKRHGIKALSEKGYKIRIFDISPVVNKIAYENVKKDLLEEEKMPVEVFYSKKEISNAIHMLESQSTLVIPYFDFSLDYLFVYRELSKANLKFGFIHRVNSEAKMPKIEKSRIFNYFKRISIHNVINSILIRIPKRFLPIKKAEFIVFGGLENREIYRKINLVDARTREIIIHALNFEDCISNEEKEGFIEQKYAVFLDQYMPFHPDHLELGIKIDPKQYYSELNKLFEKIETMLDLEVIIAAHPKADYEKYRDVFGQRKKIKFKTVPLIENAEMVIANFSTAIAYVPFYKKRLLICDSNCLNKYKYFSRRVAYWSKELDIEPVNLSDKIDDATLNQCLSEEINLDAYEQCIKDTLKGDFSWNKTEYIHFWDKFEKEVLI